MRILLATLLVLTGLSSQAATVSNVADWDGGQSIEAFGEPESATYGQTISLPETANLADSDWKQRAGSEDLAVTIQTSVVPIPAAIWLFGSALGFVVWWRPKSAGAPHQA